MKKIYNLLLLMFFLLCIVSCGKETNQIELTYEKNEITIFIGETVSVKPTSNVTDCTLVYSLSNDNAEIDAQGVLKALKKGSVVVSVTAKEDTNAKATITVVIEEEVKKDVIYTITYDTNGGKLPGNAIKSFKENVKLKLPKPTKSGYAFLGWYEGDVLIEETCNRNLNLVAKWEEIISEVKVSYVLEEGAILSNYETKADLINDLIYDIQLIRGDSYTLEFFESCESTAFNLFAGTSGNNTFFANDKMRFKWNWLLVYAKSLREAAGLDVSQYDNVINKGYVTADAAIINMEIVAFIGEKQYSYDAGETVYETSDYANYNNANNFWGTYSEYLGSNNVFDIDVYALDVLPYVTKINSRFDGWYLSSDFAESSKVTEDTIFTKDTTVYAKFTTFDGLYANITFDHDGGLSEELLKQYGSKKTSLTISGFNGEFWNNQNYANNIIISTKENDPGALFSKRIYLTKDQNSGLYQVLKVVSSGNECSWPTDADLVITISDSYNGSYDDKFDFSKINKGDIVIFDKAFTLASSSNLVTMSICTNDVSKDMYSAIVTDESYLPGALRIGYKFLGWYDGNNNLYTNVSELKGLGNITLFAKWEFVDQIIGSFVDKSWVVVGDSIELDAYYLSGKNTSIAWESKSKDIVLVEENVIVGLNEGLAEIVAYDPENPDTKFTFYVSVFKEELSGLEELIVESNNTEVYKRDDLIIGIITEPGFYYADVIGSVSKLLFEEYVVHDDYYLSNPSNCSTLVAEGIEFITFHYAADMNGSATSGGRNLASYNKSCNTNGIEVSFHFGTGNDGVWACQNEAYGAWHAGSSKAMSWHATGIKYQEGDPEFAKITLGSDNYFYLNGIKTAVKNTTSGKKLNNMGLAFKVVNGEYYISGHYYNSTYGYISATGGNKNSIGIESSVGKGSDLWLTWQYSAQLCASLLLKYDLPLIRLVGHHFFSGKWCPQPMLEYDLEIWWEFVELVRQEMKLFKNYNNAKLSFSSSSDYINDNGKVKSLPIYSECVTYDVTYTYNGETKTVTLSSIIPGLIA